MDHDQYSEEFKKVGICTNCEMKITPVSSVSIVTEAEVDDVKIVSDTFSSSCSKPPRKKQKTLDDLFSSSAKKKTQSSTPSSQPPLKTTVTKRNPKQHKPPTVSAPTSHKERTVTVATVNKWKSELTEYDVSAWLLFDTDAQGKARNLRCKFCIQFEDKIRDLPNFTDIFIKGSQNYKKSVVEDHAKNKSNDPKHPHTVAYKKYLECYNVDLEKRSEILASSGGHFSENIVSCLKKIPEEEYQKLKKKFQTAYFVVKNELPITKCKNILKLESMHGVDVGTKYLNDPSLGTFIDHIGDELKDQLAEKLNKAKFLSVLCDGSMDIATRYFDPFPKGLDRVKVNLSFLSIKRVKGGDHQAIVGAIKDSFEEVEINEPQVVPYYLKLIGFCSDGASVNRGCKESIKMVLRENSPWLLFIWCVAHRLELALEDALGKTEFKEVDEMLKQLYLLYRKASKKLRELEEFSKEYEKVYEFEEGGLKPKKASGSRWICHKLAALKLCKDKWGVFISHLRSIINDPTYKSCEQAKMKGYLKTWGTTKMILQVSFFIELLNIPATLSLVFQKEDINPLDSSRSMSKSLDRLELLMKKDFDRLPNVRDFLSKVVYEEGVYSYQGIELKNYINVKESVSKKKNYFGGLVRDCLSERLGREEESATFMSNLCIVLDCEAWKRGNEEFADDIIYNLYDRFEIPLKSAGVRCSAGDLLQQWHDLCEYAVETVGVVGRSYMVTWRMLFSSPRTESWESILIMVELLFTIPISNAKLERMFSKMKRVITAFRASTKEVRLENILRIMENDTKWEDYDPVDAINHWYNEDGKERRLKEEDGPRKYKKGQSKKKIAWSLSDTSEDNETSSENETVYKN